MSDKLIKEKPSIINIHGFPSTETFYDYNQWKGYAETKLKMVKNRISIQEFLDRDQFIKSKNDSNPEPKQVKDKIDDPIPPDTPGGAKVGQRHTGWKSSSHPDYKSKQRREWGFSEKLLQGYPQYEPDKVGYGDLNNKVIAGFVTVGDGVFSGIPSYANIKLDKEETRRQVEYGYGRVTGRDMIPTGLCFIQDDTAGIGIALGSDVRYIWHPRIYGTNLSNANLTVDDMHMGSTTIPKADYRQFLRVGDFVIIEIGTRLKYWHSLLGGSRPDYWESLVGYRELYDNMPDSNNIPGMKLDVYEKLNPLFLNIPNRYNPPLDSRGRDIYKKTLKTVPKVFGNTRNFRDVPTKDMGQPVIDHVWSTGTPIPVGAGMPYVMMEDYGVDSTDRFGPAPLLIQAENLRDLKGNGQNLGDKLKGQLIRLNNMRFVKAPKTRALSAQLAADENGDTLSPGIYTSSVFKFAPAIENAVEIQTNPNLQINFLTEVPSSYWTRILGVNDSEPFTNYKGQPAKFDPITNRATENFTQEIWKHEVTTSYGVDYSGHKFELPIRSRRYDLLPELIITEYIDDNGVRRSFSNDRWSRDQLNSYNPPQYEQPDKDGWLWQDNAWPRPDTPVQNSWKDYIITEEEQKNWTSQTSRNGLLYYEYVGNVNQYFPKTVKIDPKDPQYPYWFTDPNIPLTNAIDVGFPWALSTWLKSSTKVQAYIEGAGGKTPGEDFRRVGDLNRGTDIAEQTYYYHYENNPAIRNQWNGNNLQPEDDGYFIPNKTYYLSDPSGVVVPIRINANTEIARFKVQIPKGLVDIIGIAWQYSLGIPGMEWERESYIMQVWPRFLSDIIPFEQGIVVEDGVTQIDEVTEITDTGTPDVPVDRRPTRLPDIVLNIGDSIPVSDINSLNCDTMSSILKSRNDAIRLTGLNQPLQGCDGLLPGQEIYIIVEGDNWYGLTRTFYFRKDMDGNCTCLLVPRGTNLQNNQQNMR